MYRLDDRLFFANARYVTGRMREAVSGAPTPAHWLVLDAEGIAQIDTTGMEALGQLVDELHEDGVRLRGAARSYSRARSAQHSGMFWCASDRITPAAQDAGADDYGAAHRGRYGVLALHISRSLGYGPH